MRTLCGVLYDVWVENKYIYIDESGNTGYTKKSTRYFIITSLIVEDTFVLGRIAKSVYKIKTDKNKCNMIHAYMESAKIKHRLIEKLEYLNLVCVVFIFDKNKLRDKDPYFTLLHKLAQYFSKLEHQIKIVKLR
jgi:hypothetical protein